METEWRLGIRHARRFEELFGIIGHWHQRGFLSVVEGLGATANITVL